MEDELLGIKNTAISLILDSKDQKELEEVMLQFLGRSGRLTLSLKELPKLPIEKKSRSGNACKRRKKNNRGSNRQKTG